MDTAHTSPLQVVLLDYSPGARTARKTATAEGAELTGDGELTAQAYMLGNCAHCHNPRGFPSISKPELASLNFLPEGQDGGIFEFSFERMSPLRKRGASNDIPMPYVTPSLRDYPTTDSTGLTRIDNQVAFDPNDPGAITYTPKFPPGSGDGSKTCANVTDADDRSYCGDRKTGRPFVPAPWRSLIYRNVDAPASYFDDYVPFPRMPMHTAGFDCRAPRIMGDWMAGLPSIRKLAHLASLTGGEAPSEDVLPQAANGRAPVLGSLKTGYDDNPQPYMEVRPDSALYEKALAAARARLVEYHDGVRYQYCQDVISPDIYDPFVPEHKEYPYRPNPHQYQLTYQESPPLDPAHPDRLVQPRIGVPLHVHWIDFDPTDPPPPWVPRRTEWQDVLVNGKPDTALPVGQKPLEELAAEPYGQAKVDEFLRGRAVLVRALNEARLTRELVEYATTDRPFGLWKIKPGCEQKLAGMKSVAELAAGERPAWLDVAKPPASAPLYMMAPGASIYRHVCINCHGPNADGRGLQADLLAAGSEGEARPANFRDGMFGPPGQPLAGIKVAFDVAHSGDEAGAMQWASRYMSWMALGGTLKRIPQDIIQLVAATPVLGSLRENLYTIPGATDPTGNMLNLAKGLCAIVLPDTAPLGGGGVPAFNRFSSLDGPPKVYPPFNHEGAPLIGETYDKELWLQLCSSFSPQVLRVYGATQASGAKEILLIAMYYVNEPANPADPTIVRYPGNAPVWDHNKTTQMGVAAGNLYPACLDPRMPKSDVVGLTMPSCDVDFLKRGKLLWRRGGVAFLLGEPSDDHLQPAFRNNIDTWKLRGAIATGMSVFSYLRHRVTHPELARMPPYYDQCELLR
jgi:mono/diheme cytochrome c family protein